ncbi:hypothetical protein SAY86_007545 [Trapa natans]|uniref:Uncharacterized protein n=1 Tax=Trapa natans TaxID=22666 RepID=A0AAN7LM07_TRANT|nr:hypothetical protein SAY86_007545 [Trapa natans]
MATKTGGLDADALAYGDGLKTFPSEFPYEIDSYFESSFNFKGMAGDAAVEGQDEEQEDEEQEEDFLAELTRRLTRSSAPVPHKSASPGLCRSKPEKLWTVAGSPNSTLSGLSGWLPGQGGGISREGSPGGGSADLSPPTTPFVSENGHPDWDLICAAAGQVARLRLAGDAPICPVQCQRQVPVKKTVHSGFCSSHVPSNGLCQTNQYQRVKEEPSKRSSPPICTNTAKMNWLSQQNQQVPSRNRGLGHENNNGRCSGYWSLEHPGSAWSPAPAKSTHQSQNRPNVRALFLNGSGNINSKRAGTGVFLPRRFVDHAPEPLKRPGCSTIIPAKVVQALNLNLGDANAYSQQCFTSEYGEWCTSFNRFLL